MQKVAVFGNAGGGKSTLSRKLSAITSLPLHILDKVQFLPGGIAIPTADYQQIHADILATDAWIIDGFGSLETLWPRLEAADTLIYLDLPLPLHFWWVTKRFLSGYMNPPAGWPENTPILASSWQSYQVLWLCHQKLTPRYRQYIEQVQDHKTIYHLRSPQQITQFLAAIAER